jgi:hypothetical protein
MQQPGQRQKEDAGGNRNPDANHAEQQRQGTALQLAVLVHLPALAQHGVRWLRLFGQVFRVFKWKNCSARRRGGGNVKIGFIDFQGLVGRAENGFFVFRAFHKTGISTACLVAR